MLIMLLDFLKGRMAQADMGPFRVLDFITVRTAISLALSFLISLMIGPWVIRRLAELKAGQIIRKSVGTTAVDLASMHGKKAGTPTMGGLLMMIALLAPVLLFCRLNNIYVFLLLAMTLGYGALGFWDDYLKITQQHHRGVTARKKMLIQGALGLVLGFTLYIGNWEVYYAPT